jgi:hypothetical protein
VTAPAPAAGPASAAAVAARLHVTAEEVEVTVAAVNDLVSDWLVPRADGTWRPKHVLGAEMLAVRLYRRRNSPEGVATFTAEGAVYVQRNDPDIGQLLELGAWARPVVG